MNYSHPFLFKRSWRYSYPWLAETKRTTSTTTTIAAIAALVRIEEGLKPVRLVFFNTFVEPTVDCLVRLADRSSSHIVEFSIFHLERCRQHQHQQQERCSHVLAFSFYRIGSGNGHNTNEQSHPSAHENGNDTSTSSFRIPRTPRTGTLRPPPPVPKCMKIYENETGPYAYSKRTSGRKVICTSKRQKIKRFEK